jgi:hypothetical protein
VGSDIVRWFTSVVTGDLLMNAIIVLMFSGAAACFYAAFFSEKRIRK